MCHEGALRSFDYKRFAIACLHLIQHKNTFELHKRLNQIDLRLQIFEAEADDNKSGFENVPPESIF